MAYFFAMPKLGMDMTEGQIVSWLAGEGDQVKEGDPLLEVETDKATNEVEAPLDGILAKVVHKAGETVACSTIIAVILADGEDMPDSFPEMAGQDGNAEKEKSDAPQAEKQPQKSTSSPKTDGKRFSISPSAKRMAQELGVDLASIVPEGQFISRSDIQRAYDEQKAETASSGVEAVRKPLQGIRKLTAEHMAASAHTTARVALTVSVDAEALIAKREGAKAEDNKISYNVFLAQAAAQALREFPYMNSRLVEDEVWEIKEFNIGIAVDTERGLFVPVLRDAGSKTLVELSADYEQKVARAAAGKLNAADLESGTFTITNLGQQQIESFMPVINLPECAILGVGAIMPKPVAQDGTVVVRNQMTLSLVFDHRLVDGKPAAEFLKRLKEIIEDID
jgi:pyruvate dehydrogenase E2 component (dihydrolipoamide acetyltransferase)